MHTTCMISPAPRRFQKEYPQSSIRPSSRPRAQSFRPFGPFLSLSLPPLFVQTKTLLSLLFSLSLLICAYRLGSVQQSQPRGRRGRNCDKSDRGGIISVLTQQYIWKIARSFSHTRGIRSEVCERARERREGERVLEYGYRTSTAGTFLLYIILLYIIDYMALAICIADVETCL